MKNATLCFLMKEDKILLAMKKRGFGVGKWNGVGGKINEGETIMAATIRETKEEIDVDVDNLENVALLRFKFPYKEEWNQDVHVYLTKNWIGEPKETEEMMPKWFSKAELPYQEMWDDDKYWIPHVLAGKKLEAEFVFKDNGIVDKHEIRLV